MTKSTQQIADELARKCAESVHSLMHRLQNGAGGKHGVSIADFQRTILSEIPLPELFKIARAAEMFARHPAHYEYQDDLEQALTNLQKKVEL